MSASPRATANARGRPISDPASQCRSPSGGRRIPARCPPATCTAAARRPGSFYENGALGDQWNGLLLACEAGRNVIFGYFPQPDGAGFKLERFNFLTSNQAGKFAGSDFLGGKRSVTSELPTLFRTSDVWNDR